MKSCNSTPIKHALLLMLTCAMLAGCASTEYSDYVGGKVFTGQGGARKVVDGVEIWTSGYPPRKFVMVGVIKDSRRVGVLSGSGAAYGALARECRAHGGDAVVIMDSKTRMAGAVATPMYANTTTNVTASPTAYGAPQNYSAQSNTTFTGGNTVPLYARDTGAIVVKYVQ